MTEQMQCMEVWGGNKGVEQHFHMPGLDIWLYSRPHEDAASGGDVYYLSSCASGRISRMLLADVSGHGVAVSQPALQLRDLMRRYINSISQTRFVQEMNDEFTSISEDGKFATALVGTFFAVDGSLQLCQAGHPPPLVFRRETGKWEVCAGSPTKQAESSARNMPLGIIEQTKYGQSQFPLRPGDMLLAYTDGLTETHVATGQLLGVSGLLDLVSSIDATQPGGLLAELLAKVRQSASKPMADDLTILLARADGSGVSWRNNLLALWRLFRPVRDVTRFRNGSTAASSE